MQTPVNRVRGVACFHQTQTANGLKDCLHTDSEPAVSEKGSSKELRKFRKTSKNFKTTPNKMN